MSGTANRPLPGRKAGTTRPRFLYSHSLLPSLPREHWVQLRESAKPRFIPQGTALFVRGDGPDGCYLLREGFVKVSVASRQGEERILAVLGQGATIGEPALLEDLPRSVSVFALTDCQFLQIDRAALAAWLRDNPDAERQLIRILAAEIRHLAEEAVVTGFLSVRGRVARVLLQLAASIGKPAADGRVEIPYPLRHSDLAAIAVVTRETVSRFISQWRRFGLLSESPEGMMTFSEAKLEQELTEETNPPPISEI